MPGEGSSRGCRSLRRSIGSGPVSAPTPAEGQLVRARDSPRSSRKTGSLCQLTTGFKRHRLGNTSTGGGIGLASLAVQLGGVLGLGTVLFAMLGLAQLWRLGSWHMHEAESLTVDEGLRLGARDNFAGVLGRERDSSVVLWAASLPRVWVANVRAVQGAGSGCDEPPGHEGSAACPCWRQRTH